METIIVINEECHGVIGVAKDLASVADFLIRNHWVESFTEMWDGWENEEGKGIYITVKEKADECNITWEDFVIDACLNEDWEVLERMGIHLDYWTLYDKDKIEES